MKHRSMCLAALVLSGFVLSGFAVGCSSSGGSAASHTASPTVPVIAPTTAPPVVTAKIVTLGPSQTYDIAGHEFSLTPTGPIVETATIGAGGDPAGTAASAPEGTVFLTEPVAMVDVGSSVPSRGFIADLHGSATFTRTPALVAAAVAGQVGVPDASGVHASCGAGTCQVGVTLLIPSPYLNTAVDPTTQVTAYLVADVDVAKGATGSLVSITLSGSPLSKALVLTPF